MQLYKFGSNHHFVHQSFDRSHHETSNSPLDLTGMVRLFTLHSATQQIDLWVGGLFCQQHKFCPREAECQCQQCVPCAPTCQETRQGPRYAHDFSPASGEPHHGTVSIFLIIVVCLLSRVIWGEAIPWIYSQELTGSYR